jgi:hypothetical protein
MFNETLMFYARHARHVAYAGHKTLTIFKALTV